MKIVLQRVNSAHVLVKNEIVGKIQTGYVVLLGIAQSDTHEKIDKAVQKIKNLRIFPDDDGKTNLSIDDVGGALLVVSQFTLLADARKGNRPSFIDAGSPQLANELYEYFIKTAKLHFANVQSGVFGASMQVTLTNDGPFTILLEM